MVIDNTDNNKTRIKNLTTALGTAYNAVNILKTTTAGLKTDNDNLIEELKKSNELLNRAETLIKDKRTEDGEVGTALDDAELALVNLQREIEDLKTLNADLVEQNRQLKEQSTGIYTKSLAIVGIFASGAWIVAGVNLFLESFGVRNS